MKVTVQWDFKLSDDDAWDALSYKEQEAQADLPEVIEIPERIVEEYQALMPDHQDDAEYAISDWLSNEFGWCHYGWEEE